MCVLRAVIAISSELRDGALIRLFLVRSAARHGPPEDENTQTPPKINQVKLDYGYLGDLVISPALMHQVSVGRPFLSPERGANPCVSLFFCVLNLGNVRQKRLSSTRDLFLPFS